jgi:hypothetical protein
MRKQAVTRLTIFFLLSALLLLTVPAGQTPARQSKAEAKTPPPILVKADEVSQARLSAVYGKLPLSFEANQGQADPYTKFLSRGKGYSLFLTPTEAALRLGNADYGLPNAEQAKEPLDSLPQTPFSALHLLHSTLSYLHSAFRNPHSRIHTTHSAVVRMKLVGANPQPKVAGLEELPGKVNYFLGNDPKRWRTDIPTYGKVKYRNAYPGIDLVYYGRQQQLEYDLVVAPGADPRSIRLSFEGVDKLVVDRQGNLVLHIAAGELVQHAPHVYQDGDGAKETIPGRYVLLEPESSKPSSNHTSDALQQVGFEVDGYDPSRALVIDPVLVYSTYLGGSSDDFGQGIAIDSAHNAYVTGSTSSIDFPTANPLQPGSGGGNCSDQGFAVCPDVFVAKLASNGSALVYSTYLGGNGFDRGFGIAVDPVGNAYLTGDTTSTNFPTVDPLQPGFGGVFDAFVAKLNTAGTALVYSTYLGGSFSDVSIGIAVDAAGDAYVTGQTQSPDFPTQNPLQPAIGGGDCGGIPCNDAFVTKLNAAGSALVYSTYLGGSGDDYCWWGITVDPAASAYVTGYTVSPDFPTQNPLQPALGGPFGGDAFVAKLNPAGSALLYSTYLGGSGDEVSNSIEVGPTGSTYVTGVTDSFDLPTKNPLQPALSGETDAFVAKLNPAGTTLVYSTYLGGSSFDGGLSIAVDSAGNAYVTGSAQSTDFPTQKPVQPALSGEADAFVTKLNATGSALVYSTYLGGSGGDIGLGIVADTSGNAYLTGYTDSTDFPTQNPVEPAFGGGVFDAFVAKIESAPLAVRVAIEIKPGSSPNSINPRSNGNLPVAILTKDSFDASAVDPSTVRFGRSGEEAAPLRSSLEDIDGDADLDLVLHFATQQTGLQCGDSSAQLTGKTFDGQQLEGSDSIRTVGCQ